MIDFKATLQLWQRQLFAKPLRYTWLARIEMVALMLVAPLDARINRLFVRKPAAPQVDECIVPRVPYNPVTPLEDIVLGRTGEQEDFASMRKPCAKHTHTFDSRTGWSECSECGAAWSGSDMLKRAMLDRTDETREAWRNKVYAKPDAYQRQVGAAMALLKKHAPVVQPAVAAELSWAAHDALQGSSDDARNQED